MADHVATAIGPTRATGIQTEISGSIAMAANDVESREGIGLIVAVIDAVLLYALGVPGAFVWGVLAFVTNFIPNIGFIIGIIPPWDCGHMEPWHFS